MNTEVYWLLELDIQAGREADLGALMDEMVAATKADEPGTLTYHWSTRADGKACHIFERYADSAAVMAHLGTFGEKYAARFMEILTPTRFMVYGVPSPEAAAALAGFGAVHMKMAAGFSR